MIKRFAGLFACLSVVILLPVTAYSQKTTSTDLEKAIQDNPTGNVGEPQKGSSGSSAGSSSTGYSVQTTSTQAKLYFDGANYFASPKVKFKLTTSDNLVFDKIIYKIDDGVEQDYSGEFNLTGEGKHNIEYYGMDKIGNIENKKNYQIIIDETAPEVIVINETPVIIVNGTYYAQKGCQFSISSKDNLSGVKNVKYSLNGQDYSDYSTNFKVNAEGEVQFKVISEDNVGNQTETFKMTLPDSAGGMTVEEKTNFNYMIDNIAPVVTITPEKEFIDVNGKKVTGADNKYTVAAQDDQSGVQSILVKVDGKGGFIVYEKELEFTTNGEHFIEAKAVDFVGNVSDVVVLSFYVDIVPPNTQIQTVADEDVQ